MTEIKSNAFYVVIQNCQILLYQPLTVKNQPEAIAHWFNELQPVIDEYNITSENIYNMNESQFFIDKIESV